MVAILCGHPDNLEDSDESECRTVARHTSADLVKLFTSGVDLENRQALVPAYAF